MPGLSDPTLLSTIPLFQEVPIAALPAINEQMELMKVPSGTEIITVNQRTRTAYIILKGTVKVFVESENGECCIYAILGINEIIGELGLIDNLIPSATVATLEETTVLWFPGSTFQFWLQTIPPISINLNRILATRMRLTNAQLQSMVIFDVNGRVANILLALAREYGVPNEHGIFIPLRLTQGDIAAMVGANRVSVGRALKLYRACGAISDGERITIFTPEVLAAHCY